MADGSTARAERQPRVPGVVFVLRPRRQRSLGSVGERPGGQDVGHGKGGRLCGGWRRGRGGGEVVDGVKHDDVGGIGGSGVRGHTGGDVGVQFGGGDGGEVGGVGGWDG